MTGPRALRRQQTEQKILDAGRQQLADVGAQAVSLRAVARELNLVSSAVYRYVASRDELLTLLVVDSYTRLADAVDAAVDTAGELPRERLASAFRAFRSWAVDHPAEFALLYGSPVPGYHAPAEETNAPGTRVIGVLLAQLAAIAPEPRMSIVVPTGLHEEFADIAHEFDVSISDSTLLTGITLWTWLVGTVGQEVFGGFGAETFADTATLFNTQSELMIAALAA